MMIYVEIKIDDPSDGAVERLLKERLNEMHQYSPVEVFTRLILQSFKRNL